MVFQGLHCILHYNLKLLAPTGVALAFEIHVTQAEVVGTFACFLPGAAT